MMNTKVYKAVHNFAGELLDAAHIKDQVAFDALYADLKALCEEHEGTEKDHPVQWEALADFTDELEDAVVIYEKALVKAEEINSKDYMSSVAFSMATLQVELKQTDAAIENLKKAKISANKIADKDLKAEIDALLAKLSPDAVEQTETSLKSEADKAAEPVWPYIKS